MSTLGLETPRLFGTDGIRGAFGTYPLDEETVRRLAAALAEDLRERHVRPLVVLGGDTRDSTPVLCRWLGEGLAAGGAEIEYLGVVPTPAVAALARSLGAACGIVVSASHNPHPDNGIKLIDGDGFKWTAGAEARLEERLRNQPSAVEAVRHQPSAVEAVRHQPSAVEAVRHYLRMLVTSLDAGLGDQHADEHEDAEAAPLAGLRVAVDAGHGAASAFAGELFERLGAQATVRFAEPDGRNINAGCGATHPQVVAKLTRETGSDLGFAFDGDADRVMLADETGAVRDGDAILYLWARELDARGRLPRREVVATSMSNLGLEVALGRHDISVMRCDVGDRAVVATMRRHRIVLGGEQSGHIVNLGLSTQGDGLLTALHLAALRRRCGRPLSELLADFECFPQLLKNVPVNRKPDFETLPRVTATRDAVVERLGSRGRLVLRYSGTEPVARIMIEGPDRDEIEALADDLATVIAEELG